MYHVYNEKNHSEFSKAHVGEYKDIEEARKAAKKSIANKEGYSYVIEESNGNLDNYGDLVMTVFEESD